MACLGAGGRGQGVGGRALACLGAECRGQGLVGRGQGIGAVGGLKAFMKVGGRV